MAEHWRDQHRTQGKFKPKPGAKGFRIPVAPPEPDQPDATPKTGGTIAWQADAAHPDPPRSLPLWVDRHRRRDK